MPESRPGAECSLGKEAEQTREGLAESIQRAVKTHVRDRFFDPNAAVVAKALFAWDMCVFSPHVAARTQLRQRHPPAAPAHSRQVGCACAQGGSI